jgi:hypothetical protein
VIRFFVLDVIAKLLGFPSSAVVAVGDGYHKPRTMAVMFAVNRYALADSLRSLAKEIDDIAPTRMVSQTPEAPK